MTNFEISNHSTQVEIYATVSGSFNKFLQQIEGAVNSISALGIIVLSPTTTKEVRRSNGFVTLEGDRGSPGQIETQHLQAIARSDFLYIVNPEGYIGDSVAFEVGYALSKGIPVYASAPPSDLVISSFINHGTSLAEIKKRIKEKKRRDVKLQLKDSPSLTDLQEYMSWMVKHRGFSEEGLTEVALLLVEEVGELAKAIRFDQGLKVTSDSISRIKQIGSELADCLVYLLNLANLSNVNLEKALREKEATNGERKWVRRTKMDT